MEDMLMLIHVANQDAFEYGDDVMRVINLNMLSVGAKSWRLSFSSNGFATLNFVIGRRAYEQKYYLKGE